MSFNDVAIIYVKASAYRIHFWYMNKDDAVSTMNNSNIVDNKLVDKKGVFFFFNIYKKWVRKSIIKEQRCDTKKSKRLLWKW